MELPVVGCRVESYPGSDGEVYVDENRKWAWESSSVLEVRTRHVL